MDKKKKKPPSHKSVARVLDCMMGLHLTKIFNYIEKCIDMSMLGDNHVISIPLFL